MYLLRAFPKRAFAEVAAARSWKYSHLRAVLFIQPENIYVTIIDGMFSPFPISRACPPNEKGRSEAVWTGISMTCGMTGLRLEKDAGRLGTAAQTENISSI